MSTPKQNTPMRLGTWLHLLPGSRAEIDSVVDRLAARGIDTLITMFKSWTGTIYFPSEVAYTEPGFEQDDQFGHLLGRCHELGMASRRGVASFRKPGRRSCVIDEHPHCRGT